MSSKMSSKVLKIYLLNKKLNLKKDIILYLMMTHATKSNKNRKKIAMEEVKNNRKPFRYVIALSWHQTIRPSELQTFSSLAFSGCWCSDGLVASWGINIYIVSLGRSGPASGNGNIRRETNKDIRIRYEQAGLAKQMSDKSDGRLWSEIIDIV